MLIFFLFAPMAILIAYQSVTHQLEAGRDKMAAELLSDLEQGDIAVEKVLADRELDLDEIEKVYGEQLADIVREALDREAAILEMVEESDSTSIPDLQKDYPDEAGSEVKSVDHSLGSSSVLDVGRLEPAGGLGPTPSLEGASLEPAR